MELQLQFAIKHVALRWYMYEFIHIRKKRAFESSSWAKREQHRTIRDSVLFYIVLHFTTHSTAFNLNQPRNFSSIFLPTIPANQQASIFRGH